MPRKARIDAPGALHHIIARGIARRKVFDDNDELSIQRQVDAEEFLLKKSHNAEIIHDLESRIQAIRGGGQPLSENDRTFFEPPFGRDFSKVRVHSDAPAADVARAVNARAFSLWKNVAFREEGIYPNISQGRRLLACE